MSFHVQDLFLFLFNRNSKERADRQLVPTSKGHDLDYLFCLWTLSQMVRHQGRQDDYLVNLRELAFARRGA